MQISLKLRGARSERIWGWGWAYSGLVAAKTQMLPLYTLFLLHFLPWSLGSICGNADSSGRAIWGVATNSPLPSFFRELQLWKAAPLFLPVYAPESCDSDLLKFWCTDLSDMFVYWLCIICWVLDFQVIIISRGEIQGDASLCHASDIILYNVLKSSPISKL